MSVMVYILISTVSLSIFYLAYKLIYKNETNFRHLRFYLMGSILFSLLLPLDSYTLDVVKKRSPVMIQVRNIPATPADQPAGLPGKPGMNWPDIASKLYFLIVFVLMGKVILQLILLTFQYLRSDKIKQKNCVILLNHRFRNTFSFFGWIFLARDSTSDEDLEQIIAHERIHAAQYHSFDLIIIELLTAVMWFNPLIWMMKNSVQLVHEYLADEGALNTGIDRLRYQALLINQVTEERLIGLSSSFNQSLIKKRMKMMTNRKFTRRSRLKILALLPLSAMLFIMMAMVNGFFPERLRAGTFEKTSELIMAPGSKLLPLLNPDSPGDTIKKKTVVKIIKKENPGDTLVTETIEVIVSGDTAKTVKVIGHDGKARIEHEGDLIFISEDEDVEHLIGTNHDSVKVVKLIKVGEDSEVRHDEKYDVKHDNDKQQHEQLKGKNG